MSIVFLNAFKAETEWLAREYEEAALLGVSRSSQLACEMVVVRLHDSWSRCCRSMVLQSACGCSTLSGIKLGPVAGVTNEADALTKYYSSFIRARRYEPKWYSAGDAIDAAQRINIQNRSAVVAALSSVSSPAEEMRHVRNYYAHRGKGTSDKALATGLFPGTDLSVFNLSSFGPGGETILRGWIRQLRLIAHAAML